MTYKIHKEDWITKKKISSEKYKVIAADIETCMFDSDNHYPVSIGYYDGNTYKIFNVWDNLTNEKCRDIEEIKKESSNIINNFLKSVWYNYAIIENVYVYFHNLSNFDGYFLLNTIFESQMNTKIEPGEFFFFVIYG